MSDFITVPYDASIQKLASYFDCGNSVLNAFLKSSKALDNNYGKTYVFLSDDKDAIVGYYCIGTGYLKLVDEYGEWKAGGSIHICDLALDKRYQGIVQKELPDGNTIKLSDVLLFDCLSRIRFIRQEHVGFTFVTLAATAQGKNLYVRSGFEELDEDFAFAKDEAEGPECTQMYLALDVE